MNLYILASFSHQIEVWNEKLNEIVGKYTDSPWAGMAIFLILFVFGCCAVSAFSKK